MNEGRWRLSAENRLANTQSEGKVETDFAVCPHEASGTLLRLLRTQTEFVSQNYNFTFNVKMASGGGNGQNAGSWGVAWRVQDRKNFYLFDWHQGDGCMTMWEVDDKEFKEMDSGSRNMQLDRVYKVELIADGADFSISIDGQRVLSGDDGTRKTGGVALWTSGTASVSFDDLVVVELKSQQHLSTFTAPTTNLCGARSAADCYYNGFDGLERPRHRSRRCARRVLRRRGRRQVGVGRQARLVHRLEPRRAAPAGGRRHGQRRRQRLPRVVWHVCARRADRGDHASGAQDRRQVGEPRRRLDRRDVQRAAPAARHPRDVLLLPPRLEPPPALLLADALPPGRVLPDRQRHLVAAADGPRRRGRVRLPLQRAHALRRRRARRHAADRRAAPRHLVRRRGALLAPELARRVPRPARLRLRADALDRGAEQQRQSRQQALRRLGAHHALPSRCRTTAR
jgi:hypothetical protein